MMGTKVKNTLVEVFRVIQSLVASCKGALGVSDLPTGIVFLIQFSLFCRAHWAALGPAAFTTAQGGAGSSPCGSKGLHVGGHCSTRQHKVVTPVPIEIPTEATETSTEGTRDGHEDVGIAIEENLHSLVCLQNYVSAFGCHTHVACGHRQGHDFTIHSHLCGRVS